MGTDNLFHKKRAARKKTLAEAVEYRRTQWLILCEGSETEPNYFDGLIKHLFKIDDSSDVADIHGKGLNTKELVKSAKDYFQLRSKELRGVHMPYDSKKIIFAFDKDSFPKEHFNTAIQMANDKCAGCHVAWSNESFELWLCLHFEYVQASMTRYQLNDKLTDIFRKNGVLQASGRTKQNYADHGKSIPNIFEAIKTCGGSYTTAIRNAEKLTNERDLSSPTNASPATMVHKAVQALISESQRQ